MSLEVFEQVYNKVNSVKAFRLNHPDLKEEKGPEIQKKINSARELGQTHYKLAKVYYDKSELDKAEFYFLKALAACEFPEDSFAMLKITGFLIRVYSELMKLDDTERSIKLSQTLIQSAFSSMEWTLKPEYLFYLGANFTYQGDFEEANKNFELAIKKAQESNEPEIVAKSFLYLSQNLSQLGKLEESYTYLAKLEQLLSILNKGYLKGSMYLQYGNICLSKGDAAKAIENFKKSLNELSKKSCWNLSGYIMLGLGKAYKKLGDYKKATLHFDLARDFCNPKMFKKLYDKIENEINEVNDSNIDFIIDKTERVIKEKNLGVIDFKHRFVLLEILYLLASNPGKHFDKEDLSREIWKEEYNPLIHDKLIYTSISRLRKLIEPGGEKNKYIIRGKDGYNFSPHVKVRFCNYASTNKGNGLESIEISSPI